RVGVSSTRSTLRTPHVTARRTRYRAALVSADYALARTSPQATTGKGPKVLPMRLLRTSRLRSHRAAHGRFPKRPLCRLPKSFFEKFHRDRSLDASLLQSCPSFLQGRAHAQTRASIWIANHTSRLECLRRQALRVPSRR